jgi:hypothetical protein
MSPEPFSDKTPVLLPDKTANNRHTASEISNDPIFPTSRPVDPPFQTYSNEIPDRAPDKTANNRKINLEKLNFGDPQRRSTRGHDGEAC